MQQPQQDAFAFEDNEVPLPVRPIDPERERQLVYLMTQALNAVLQHREGEENESA